MLTFERLSSMGRDLVALEVESLVIAGWTGRDEAALRHHIEELAVIGVPPPSNTPVYYRVAAANVTQAAVLDVLGPGSSGEVEPVIVSMADGLWLGVGSDHTDRQAEAAGIALSKQLCGKPLGRSLWRFEDVVDHWDALILRSTATIDGQAVLYQQGPLSALRHPQDLMARCPGGPALPPGMLMYCGTLGVIGGIRPASHFAMELHDPVMSRSLRHAYAIRELPVIS